MSAYLSSQRAPPRRATPRPAGNRLMGPSGHVTILYLNDINKLNYTHTYISLSIYIYTYIHTCIHKL